MKEVVLNDTIIKVGATADENWILVDSNKEYTWLHLNSFPSCHVVIESAEQTQEEIMFAA